MVDFLNIAVEKFGLWSLNHGFKIVGILIAAYLFYKFGGSFIEKIVRKAIVPGKFLSKDAEKKREDTLIRVFTAVLRVAVFVLSLLMALSELSVDITPLIAGAGIVGIAVGFGGQYLNWRFV